jgi:hypothetical protein
MKRLAILLPIIAIPSCASMMNKHRMKAAERKMLTASHLQQTEHWDEAIDMVQRMQSSVSKSITPIPVQKSASGAEKDLRALLFAWEKGPLAELKHALMSKDHQRYATAFVMLRQDCIACHVSLGRMQVQVSEIP